jgi:hypothetical protein
VYKTAELWQVKEPLPLPPPAPKKRNCSMVFTLKEMEEATGMFSDKNLIGKGGFGRVYRGVLKDGQVSSVSTRNTYGSYFQIQKMVLFLSPSYRFQNSGY